MQAADCGCALDLSARYASMARTASLPAVHMLMADALGFIGSGMGDEADGRQIV
jgi:hypothetical protein